jgi:predicted nucleic acid-binding protein
VARSSRSTRCSYLDSSALVKLCIDEPEGRALAEALKQLPERLSSKLSVVEVARNVKRRQPAGLSAASRVLARTALIDIDDHLLERAREIEPIEVRSPDAIHVATAASIGLALAAFITYDRRQAEAARKLGMRVLSPGLEG